MRIQDTYSYQTHVAFDQCDPSGVIFYASIFEIAHRALERFIESTSIEWSDWFASKRYAVPIVHAEADFKSPLRAGQSISVSVGIDQLGETSVAFVFEITNDSELFAVVKTVHVFLDKIIKSKIQVPDKIRSKLLVPKQS